MISIFKWVWVRRSRWFISSSVPIWTFYHLYVSLCPCSPQEIIQYRAACFDFFNVDDFLAVNMITKYFNSRASASCRQSHSAFCTVRRKGERNLCTQHLVSVAYQCSSCWLHSSEFPESTPSKMAERRTVSWAMSHDHAVCKAETGVTGTDWLGQERRFRHWRAWGLPLDKGQWSTRHGQTQRTDCDSNYRAPGWLSTLLLPFLSSLYGTLASKLQGCDVLGDSHLLCSVLPWSEHFPSVKEGVFLFCMPLPTLQCFQISIHTYSTHNTRNTHKLTHAHSVHTENTPPIQSISHLSPTQRHIYW